MISYIGWTCHSHFAFDHITVVLLQVALDDWNYFMRGATGAQVDIPAKPDVPWLQLWQWQEACKLDAVLPAFNGLRADMTTTPCWVKFGIDNNVVCSSTSLI